MTKTDELPTNVIAALARVMEELPAIGKSEKSNQGYSYRGIEQVTAQAQRLFGRYGIVFAPRVVDRTTVALTVNGKPWTEEQLMVAYTVYGPGGIEDKIEVGPVLGLGRDNSDKGGNKALTQAFKYALLQTLCVSDAKDDADRDVAYAADPPEQTVNLASLVKNLTKDQKEALKDNWDSDFDFPPASVPKSRELEARELIAAFVDYKRPMSMSGDNLDAALEDD